MPSSSLPGHSTPTRGPGTGLPKSQLMDLKRLRLLKHGQFPFARYFRSDDCTIREPAFTLTQHRCDHRSGVYNQSIDRVYQDSDSVQYCRHIDRCTDRVCSILFRRLETPLTGISPSTFYVCEATSTPGNLKRQDTVTPSSSKAFSCDIWLDWNHFGL